MNKLLTGALVIGLALAACAHASAVTLTLGEPRTVGLMTGIPLTLTNVGRRAHDKVVVTCSFADADGAPVTTGKVYLPPIARGASVTESFLLDPRLAPVARHDCKVD